ncbi:MAG: hypothetical protein A2Z78_00010 [Candidatus Nealsonbacteria bacterium RBG_13_36_15]|uniref:Serine protease n=1 Tax=Candidatus Nealsonbacteria bacterium RBG_13_36_15 TaxID=1801660 RepID=A0A1G2DX46_9BACT|nr:MAG: hypothetical protein A2Z78_00010 [Candidatus Nealsonbacteria bacterium RBG_13_36_15]
MRILSILVVGALGGIIFQAFILPYLATKNFFRQFGFVKILTEKEVNLYPEETVIVQENKALQDIVEKVEKSIIAVRAQSAQGKIIEGSGLVLTNGGDVVTLGSLLPVGYNFSFFWNGEKVAYEDLEVDKTGSLVKLKIDKRDLPTLPFADLGSVKKGQRVFLVGIIFEGGEAKKIVNEGIIKTFDEELIRTNIFENSSLIGSPLFDIEGKVLGLNIIDKEGKVTAISIKKIREFTGF